MNTLFSLTKDQEEHAIDLHRKFIIIDSLNPGPVVWSRRIIERVSDLAMSGFKGYILEEVENMGLKELVEDAKTREDYIRDIKTSGVTAVNSTVDGVWKSSWWTFEAAIQGLSRMDFKIDKLREILVRATRADDIRKAKANGKMAVIYGFQNTNQIGEDLENIDLFYRFGVRIIQLTYNTQNFVGRGNSERYREQSGLSHFGTRFVERLNKLGIIVDTGHCGPRTTLDALEVSKDPIAASHTACKALYDIPRAKSDDEMKAIAEKGGYIGIWAVPFMYPPKDRTINHFLDEIDYIVDIAGVDHVGVGTDHFGPYPAEIADAVHKNIMESAQLEERGFRSDMFNSIDTRLATTGIEFFNKWPNITKGLVSRGYSDLEIEKIVGGNFLRLFDRVVG